MPIFTGDQHADHDTDRGAQADGLPGVFLDVFVGGLGGDLGLFDGDFFQADDVFPGLDQGALELGAGGLEFFAGQVAAVAQPGFRVLDDGLQVGQQLVTRAGLGRDFFHHGLPLGCCWAEHATACISVLWTILS